MLDLVKDMQHNIFPDENIQLSVNYSQNPADLWNISRYIRQPSSPISNGVMNFMEPPPNEENLGTVYF